jgi:hypothetical protein
MHRMYRDPPQRPFASFRVVIDNFAIPVLGGQSGQDIAEQLRSIRDLAGHILGLLLGIPIVHNPLVTSRWRTVRPIHAPSREYPLALNKEHVPQMAAILQRRPDTGPTSRSQVDVASTQDCHDLGDSLPDIPPDQRKLTEVVNETAIRTLIRHPVIVIERMCGRLRFRTRAQRSRHLSLGVLRCALRGARSIR